LEICAWAKGIVMAKISRQEVLDIARISNLEVHSDEIESLMHQLEQVLSYAERVKEVTDVQEFAVHTSNVFREDTITTSNPETLLMRAPEREGNYFVVPLILEGGDKKESVEE